LTVIRSNASNIKSLLSALTSNFIHRTCALSKVPTVDYRMRRVMQERAYQTPASDGWVEAACN